MLHCHFYPPSVNHTTKLHNPNIVCLNKYIIFTLCATDSCVVVGCGEQLYRQLCQSVHLLSVCLYVCVCVCVPITPFLPCSYYLIFMKFTPDIGLIKCFWPIPFQVTRSKVKVTGIIQIFVMSAPWPFWPVCFIFGTNMFCSILTLSLLGWITSYVAYIQHMTGRCVMNLFQDKRSRSHGSLIFFTASTL